jgi:hypothetical protein
MCYIRVTFAADLGETGLPGAAARGSSCEGERGHGDVLCDGAQGRASTRFCASTEYLQQPCDGRVRNVAGTAQTDYQEVSYQ